MEEYGLNMRRYSIMGFELDEPLMCGQEWSGILELICFLILRYFISGRYV